jgi:hypothetical protein
MRNEKEVVRDVVQQLRLIADGLEKKHVHGEHDSGIKFEGFGIYIHTETYCEDGVERKRPSRRQELTLLYELDAE